MAKILSSSSTAGASTVTGIENNNSGSITALTFSAPSSLRVSGTWYQNTSGTYLSDGDACWVMISLNNAAGNNVYYRSGTTGTIRTFATGDADGYAHIGVLWLPGDSIMATGWRKWREHYRL